MNAPFCWKCGKLVAVAEQSLEVHVLLKRLTSLEAQIVHLRAKVADLRAADTRLQAENNKLKHQLEQNSHNLPSSDGHWKNVDAADASQRQEAKHWTAQAHGSHLTGSGESRPSADPPTHSAALCVGGHLACSFQESSLYLHQTFQEYYG